MGRVRKSTGEYRRVRTSTGRVRESLEECGRIWESIEEYLRVRESVGEYGRVPEEYRKSTGDDGRLRVSKDYDVFQFLQKLFAPDYVRLTLMRAKSHWFATCSCFNCTI